jgi:hypothetical protein
VARRRARRRGPALAAATEQLYQATARNWWRHHPHRAAVTGRVALPKWIEL